MRKADQITGAILLALSIYIIITAVSLELWWGDEGPGSGFVPFWVGIFLAISSLVLIFSTLNKRYKEENVFSPEGLKLLAALTGSALIAGLLVNILGMVMAMGLLAGFLVTVLAEERKTLTTLGMVIVLPLVLYLIFQVALDVPFPKGIIGI